MIERGGLICRSRKQEEFIKVRSNLTAKLASELRQKQKELEEKIKETPNGKVVYENEAVSLELSLNAIEQKQNEYRDYMEKLMDKWTNVEMLVSTEQQTDSMKEATEEQMKILEVARRLMKGAKVPQADEMKLMKFDSGLYQVAKSIGAMVQKDKTRRIRFPLGGRRGQRDAGSE